MCGIAGIASRTGVRGFPLEAMRDTMAHRGPDDCGAWVSPDARVAPGPPAPRDHRSVSGGHQPMLDATGSLSIVFNGEIYNYRSFATSCARPAMRSARPAIPR
jgi:asparagine synthase (glutamine-hydrolysing)